MTGSLVKGAFESVRLRADDIAPVVAGGANPLVGMLGLFDPDGVNPGDYSLPIEAGSWGEGAIWKFFVDLPWAPSMVAGAWAVAAKALVLTSGKAVDALTRVWHKLADPVLAYFPPGVVFSAALLVLVWRVFYGRFRSLSLADKNERLAAALLLSLFATFVATDPFALARVATSVPAAISDQLASGINGTSQQKACEQLAPRLGTGAESPAKAGPRDWACATSDVHTALRAPTLIVAYRELPAPECVKAYSLVQGKKQGPVVLEQCLTEKEKDNARPGIVTVMLAVCSFFVNWFYWLFSAVGIWKFVVHFSGFMYRLGLIAYAAAHSIARDEPRRYDRLIECLVKAGIELALVYATWLYIKTVPSVLLWAGQEVSGLLPAGGAFAALGILGTGYYWARRGFVRITYAFEPLRGRLEEGLRDARFFRLLAPSGKPPGVVSQMLDRVVPEPVKTFLPRLGERAAGFFQSLPENAADTIVAFARELSQPSGGASTAGLAERRLEAGQLAQTSSKAPAVDAATETVSFADSFVSTSATRATLPEWAQDLTRITTGAPENVSSRLAATAPPSGAGQGSAGGENVTNTQTVTTDAPSKGLSLDTPSDEMTQPQHRLGNPLSASHPAQRSEEAEALLRARLESMRETGGRLSGELAALGQGPVDHATEVLESPGAARAEPKSAQALRLARPGHGGVIAAWRAANYQYLSRLFAARGVDIHIAAEPGGPPPLAGYRDGQRLVRSAAGDGFGDEL